MPLNPLAEPALAVIGRADFMAVKQLKFVRSNGKSALGIHEYISRKGDHRNHVDKCLVTGSANLPEFAGGNPQVFWKMADSHERANAKRCTHVVLALPRELSVEAQAQLMEDFVSRNFKGCPLSWAIHEGKEQHNPHAHLQICERRIETEREAKFSEKRFFKRNGVKKDRTLNERKFCSHLYRQYAGTINHHLQRAGSPARISLETKKEAFLEMSLIEKINKSLQYELAKMEKKQTEEMAILLQKLNKENKEPQGETNNEFRRREPDFARAESADFNETGNSGNKLEPTGQETFSGGSHVSSLGSEERSFTSEEYLEQFSEYNDSGDTGVESGAGSAENAGSYQKPATVGTRLLELTKLAVKVLFRNKWLGKLKLFKKENFSEIPETSQNRQALDVKIDREINNFTFDLKVFSRKAMSSRVRREHQESIEVQKLIDRMKEGLNSQFTCFQGLHIKKKYKTVVIARQEIRNFFGTLKSSQDVIIGFHTHYNVSNEKDSAAKCSIEEVRNSKPKSNWKVYELQVERGKSLKDLLNEKCQGFSFDPSLFKREKQAREQIKTVIERQIEDLKRSGFRPAVTKLSSTLPGEQNQYSRGIRI